MKASDNLAEFGLLALLVTVALFPIIASIIVGWITKHPLPRPRVFVLLCAAVSYGIGTFFSLVGALLEMLNSFLRAGAQAQGHDWFLQVSSYISANGFLVLFPILLIISVAVPFRVSRSWSSLVAAWT